VAAVARWCFRHRFAVFALRAAALAVLAVAGGTAKSRYNSSFPVSGSG